MKQIYIKIMVVILLLICTDVLLAQEFDNTLNFDVQVNGSTLVLEQEYFMDHIQDSAYISTCKFYISDIVFTKDGNQVDESFEKYNLIDVSKPVSLTISRKNNESFDAVEFSLGIDSLTNTSGVYGGALDPMFGMYWAWQSGYINFKLEGVSSVCKSRNNEFQYHLGGYMKPDLAVQRVLLECPLTKTVGIALELSEVITFLNLSEDSEIMRPCHEAVEFSKHIVNQFKIQK
ncbi:hypothetical protein N9B82_01055 [Saprospiraceae bacterium]|nr:hypothetical protein [Saprospiraceae bacterium]